MKRISLKFLFPLFTLILLIILLNRQVGIVPALGKVFNPYSGVVQNEQDDAFENRTLGFENRHFEIHFDTHRVPHVIADNERDMHFAQGFVTASDRLWQMEFMTYAASGRLSEIFGETYLTYDRFQRRMAIPYAAEKTLAQMENDPLTKQAMDQYTAGVNAYIKQISDKNLPFEYKLLDYQPEKWTNLKSVLVMKYVGFMLTGYEEDLSSSHMLASIGEEDFFQLYPDARMSSDSINGYIQDVMQHLPYKNHIDYSFLNRLSRVPKSAFDPRLGSNAWAIGSEKSKTGNPILCNDPHLNLSFPSIWYEIQLKSDERNTSGFSIPGTPGVIIGFNDSIAWGVTNGSTDVRDWYKMELKEDYSAYKMDGIWKKTRMRIERIKIRDKTTYCDTVYFSEHGPLVVTGAFNESKELKNFALKWVLHQPTNEFKAIILMNKATNHTAFQQGIRYFKFPAQNFIYADSKGVIAYKHQGMILRRKQRGMGKFILDGTRSDHLMHTYLQDDELPQIINPIDHFVCSANNNPWDNNSAFYVNGYYAELRADKIRDVLKTTKKFSVRDMQQLQLSNVNHFAELALPVLLNYIEHDKTGYKKRLMNWNADYQQDNELPAFFEDWINEIEFQVWDEIYAHEFLRYPDKTVLLNLMRENPHSKFFDRKDTKQHETAESIIRNSFGIIAKRHIKKPVKWGERNKVSILHLTKLPAFSDMEFSASGHPDALNAISANWGPSMRMVVELGKHPKAYGTMAGGTSGNMASAYSKNFMAEWKAGHYHIMHLFQNKNDAIKNSQFYWKSNK